MAKSVLIAGAGLGGLATALRLAKRGYKVEIIEKNGKAGGRLNQLKKDGFTFDTGPSFFSMSYEFTDFAKDCKIKLPFQYYRARSSLFGQLQQKPRNVSPLQGNLQTCGHSSGKQEPGFETGFRRYLDKSKRLYHDTNVVIKSNYDSHV